MCYLACSLAQCTYDLSNVSNGYLFPVSAISDACCQRMSIALMFTRGACSGLPSQLLVVDPSTGVKVMAQTVCNTPDGLVGTPARCCCVTLATCARIGWGWQVHLLVQHMLS
jgi:hypothetical protein